MIGKPIEVIQWLYNQDKDVVFEIKEHKEKRSLNANSYAWVLITELGNVLRKSKEEVYIEKIKDYGQSELVVVASIVKPKDYFKYYDEVGETEVKGNSFKWYRVYRGSSEYNTREMAIFIDGIIQDCKELGIETLPPNELKSLKESWCR